MELLEDNCSVCVCMGVWGGGGWGRCVPACMSEGQWKQISVQSELQCVADELTSALSTDLAVAVQIEKLQAVCCGWKPKSSAWCTSSIEPLTLNPRYLSQTMDQTFPCHIESDDNLFFLIRKHQLIFALASCTTLHHPAARTWWAERCRWRCKRCQTPWPRASSPNWSRKRTT